MILILPGLACQIPATIAKNSPQPGVTTAPTASPLPLSTSQQPAPTSAPQPSSSPAVPAAYQALYATLQDELNSAETRWPATPGGQPPLYAAELLVADDNRGPVLLNQGTMPSVRLYLDRLQAMGIKSVKNAIQYPLLTPNFPDYARYLDFYRQVGQEIHQRGMVWVIQASILFANTPFSPVTYNYSGLTFDAFMQQYRQMVVTIINELKPDYLTLIGEPDTAAHLTGLAELNRPDQEVRLINYVLGGLDRGNTAIGSGTGTWSPLQFVQGMATQTSLDFISLHFYPMDKRFQSSADQMAEIAQQNGKYILITEAWLYKTDQPGGGQNVAAAPEIYKRDAYSFWTPLDEQFIRVMDSYSRKYNVKILSFFWSNLFFGSIEYDPGMDNQPFQTIQKQVNQAATANLLKGQYSPLGDYYKLWINGQKPAP